MWKTDVTVDVLTLERIIMYIVPILMDTWEITDTKSNLYYVKQISN